jgi:PAS domain S-box-containing protein
MELSEKKKLFSVSINARQIIISMFIILFGLSVLFVLIGNKFSNQTIKNVNFSVNAVIIIFGIIVSTISILSVYLTRKMPPRNLESVKPKYDLKREIMERHNSGEELRISEHHNRDIIEKSLGFICTHKLDGTLLSINPAAANSLGYSPNEMIGKKISDFMLPSAGRFFNGYLNKIQKKRELSGTFEVIGKSGVKRIWDYNNTLYEKNGEESYILGHAVDVTDRNRIEKELKNARNAAIESARIKAEFLANMSHEIRTPMNGVLGMTELLADTPLNDIQREYLDTIKKSGESLLTIINDILDFSKMEAGKLRFEKIDFDLRHTVENSVEIFAEQAAGKHLELASLVNSDVEVALRGDPGRLRQILTNLVGNAVKFTDKGEIVVRVAKERETKRNIVLKFSVSDTGIGMHPEAQEFLFQAFRQADGSITRRFGGTGLGLTISKQLVEMMNGEINVESNLGEGSIFTFTATFEKQPARKKENQLPQADLTNLRTLIVDDNETNRKILVHQIESLGIVVEEAEDGKTALAKLQTAAEIKNPFDLVILDLLMPEMDGFKLAREIREDSRISDVRLILMPSFGRRGHGKIAKKFNIDGYLIKPIKQADLFDCISAVTAGTQIKPEDKKIKIKKQLVTRHTIKENRYKNKELILIAEDNAVNQKLIKIQLEKIGFRADVVENGVETLKALEKNSYALILMDCQMPEMDGYATTEQIRRNADAEKRIPIIAISANVMPDEIEKCFVVGMDDFLAKPFSQEKLETAIGKWLTKTSDSPKSKKTLQKTKTPKLNAETDLKSVIAKEVEARMNELESEIGFEVVDEIISLFNDDSAQRLEKLRKAVKEKDFLQIKIEAHGLKGSCGNVGAKYIADLCLQIENDSEEKNLKDVKFSFKKIEILFPELKDIFSKITDAKKLMLQN